MASRIEGPDPPHRSGDPWTRADVERWIVMPMKILREQGVMAAPGNTLMPFAADTPAATFDMLAFARTVLGKGTPELLAVMTWARIKAAGGNVEASIAEWCREKGPGWSRATFDRRRIKACDRIAAAKNEADARSREDIAS